MPLRLHKNENKASLFKMLGNPACRVYTEGWLFRVIMESTRVNQSLIPSFLSPSPNHLCKVPSLIPVHSVVGSVMENFPQASLTSSEDVCKS